MTFQKKIRNKFQMTRGRARQKLGRATGNRRMQAAGLADRIGGNVSRPASRSRTRAVTCAGEAGVSSSGAESGHAP